MKKRQWIVFTLAATWTAIILPAQDTVAPAAPKEDARKQVIANIVGKVKLGLDAGVPPVRCWPTLSNSNPGRAALNSLINAMRPEASTPCSGARLRTSTGRQLAAQKPRYSKNNLKSGRNSSTGERRELHWALSTTLYLQTRSPAGNR